MIIQLFGMDAKTRELVGKEVAKKLDAWYLDSRDLPMGHTQPQQARWLRVIAKAYDRNYHGDIITSGYFATIESREQYRIEAGREIPDFSVFIDTIPHDQFHTIPGYLERKVQLVDDHSSDAIQELNYWEETTDSDYDIRITENTTIENMSNYIIEKYKEKMQTYKVHHRDEQGNRRVLL